MQPVVVEQVVLKKLIFFVTVLVTIKARDLEELVQQAAIQ